MNKSVIGIVIAVVAVLGIVGVVAMNGPDQSSDSANTSQQNFSTPSSSQPEASPSATTESPNSVSIKDFSFQPTKLTVKKGTTVTWTNQDSVGHTVTPDMESEAFQGSGMLDKNDSYSFTFNTPGTYTYFCKPHPNMKGTIEVTE